MSFDHDPDAGMALLVDPLSARDRERLAFLAHLMAVGRINGDTEPIPTALVPVLTRPTFPAPSSNPEGYPYEEWGGEPC